MLPPSAPTPVNTLLADLARAGVTDIVGEETTPWFTPFLKPAAPKKAAAPVKKTAPKPATSARKIEDAPIPKTPPLWAVGDPQKLLILTATSESRLQERTPFTKEEMLLLTKMLSAIGIGMEHVGFAATCLTKPLDKATLQALQPALNETLAPLEFPAVLGLGQVGAALLTGKLETLGDARETTPTYQNKPAGITFHPRSLLKQPSLKRLAWQDLQNFQTRYEMAGL